jgi:hypothetical protein
VSQRRHPTRFFFKALLTITSAGLAFITALWPDWIEFVFQIDPDNHSGVLEWGIVLGCLAMAAFFGFLARLDWRTASALAQQK